MKKFVVDDTFWNLFPGASFGVVVAQNMQLSHAVDSENLRAIEQLLTRANALAERHLESPTLSENDCIRVWRQAYQQFKSKRGARCSIENLLKRVLKGNPVSSISPSVDIYNAISLKYALPLGGEDIDTFQGDLVLRITEGGDSFTPLGEKAENDPTLPGELAYLDDAGAVCRCWNWRDGVRTAISEDTHNAFLIVESVDPHRIEDCRLATNELADLIATHLGAEIYVQQLITKENREVIIAE